jgi:hypothetical protein
MPFSLVKGFYVAEESSPLNACCSVILPLLYLINSRHACDHNMRTMCGSSTGGWSLPCVMSD